MTVHFTDEDADLRLFRNSIKDVPLLTKEEEFDYARRWHELKDPAALKALTISHLRFVLAIAKKYHRGGTSLIDLVSEGNIGLLKAIDRFDISRGLRLSTMARWWIAAEIRLYLFQSRSIIKLPSTQVRRRIIHNVELTKQKLGILTPTNQLSGDDIEKIAKSLDVPTDIVLDTIVSMQSVVSLSTPFGDEEDSTLGDSIADPSESFATVFERQDEFDARLDVVKQAISCLPNDRMRDIFIQRRLRDDPLTLEELGEHYKITRERVRQIEVQAFNLVSKFAHNEEKRQRVFIADSMAS